MTPSTAQSGRGPEARACRFAELARRQALRAQGRSEGAACATPRRTRSSASRCRGPTFRARSTAGTRSSTTSRSRACCTAASCVRRRSAPSSSPSTRRRSSPSPVRGSCASTISSASLREANGRRCAAARLLKARWSDAASLMGAAAVRAWMRAGPFVGDETLVKKGDARRAISSAKRIAAEFYLAVAIACVDGAVVCRRRRSRRQGDDLVGVAGHAPVPH